MVMERKFWKMGQDMKGCFQMEKWMEMVFIFLRMERNGKDLVEKDLKMEKEHLLIIMEINLIWNIKIILELSDYMNK